MAMALKPDGRSRRGRCWKEWNTCGKPINQGVILGGKMCSQCNQDPDNDKEVIKCMKCCHLFHSTCLHMPISEETMKVLSKNPSLWWFCLTCVTIGSTDSVTSSEIGEGNSGNSDIILQTTLTSFKKEMLTSIS